MKTPMIKIWNLRSVLFLLLIIFISANPYKSFAQEQFTIVLDAGHGGKDPGKHSGKYFEKNIALNIVLMTGKLLSKNKNINVIYTRNKDVFIELNERGKIANDASADLFVSVHCNAHHTQAFGSETYVLGLHANQRNFEVAKQENSVIFLEDNYKEKYAGFDPNSPEAVIGLTLMQEEYLDESLLLASNIQSKFTNNLKRKNRGVKQAGFVVLHQTYMPSVLIETGFITNKDEGAFLNSKSGQEKFAKAIYTAVIDYKKHLDENRVVEEIPDLIPEVIETVDRIFKEVDFKVQIASSTKKLALKSYNFKGLKDVERLKVGKQYKYYYGLTSNYDKILEVQKQARKKGFPSAFVIAYKNEKKISVSELLKSSRK
ncbi:MAG: N-acetylmuramoyl-L-alanine amidase [Flavobacteriaceae bacterium]|nr:N-acetylmuramoyl-L-alanine amidase [Flavobacteriaceae bacterium]